MIKMKNDTKRKQTDNKLSVQVQKLLRGRGTKALEMAKDAILEEEIQCKAAREALEYFMTGCCTYARTQFHYPILLSLACEAVGGDPEEATTVEAAMILIMGGVDIHDDLIDQSKEKDLRQTVYGKFGKHIALLVGDALLIKGFKLLYDAGQSIPVQKMTKIFDVVNETFFELGDAEALEVNLRKKILVTPQEYMHVIKMKASIAEAQAKIGAIIGCGVSERINTFGTYGKILGILLTIRDDIIDVFEPYELRSRVVNECLPLPILYTLQNPKNKEKISHIIHKDEITKKDVAKLVEIVFKDKKVQDLLISMRQLANEAIRALSDLPNGKHKQNLELLISAILEDL